MVKQIGVLRVAVWLCSALLVSACGSSSSNPCGNGVLDAGETCDKAITTGEGACPASCDDSVACTTDSVENADTCTVACVHTAVTSCFSGDGCCPADCDYAGDIDCPNPCGNGVLDTGETCDTGISSGEDACPAICDDSNAATTDTLLYPSTCKAYCAHVACVDDDGQCGLGCSKTGDNDCVDLTGTWYTRIITQGTMKTELASLPGTAIDIIARIVVTKEVDNTITAQLEACQMGTSGKYQSQDFSILYDAALALHLFSTGEQESVYSTIIDGTVFLPDLIVVTGWDSSRQPVDSDNDLKAGTTLIIKLGTANIDAYVGLIMTTIFKNMVLADANTMEGVVDFSINGWAFSMGEPIGDDGAGIFGVVPDSNALSVSLSRLEGTKSCAEVLTHF